MRQGAGGVSGGVVTRLGITVLAQPVRWRQALQLRLTGRKPGDEGVRPEVSAPQQTKDLRDPPVRATGTELVPRKDELSIQVDGEQRAPLDALVNGLPAPEPERLDGLRHGQMVSDGGLPGDTGLGVVREVTAETLGVDGTDVLVESKLERRVLEGVDQPAQRLSPLPHARRARCHAAGPSPARLSTMSTFTNGNLSQGGVPP